MFWWDEFVYCSHWEMRIMRKLCSPCAVISSQDKLKGIRVVKKLCRLTHISLTLHSSCGVFWKDLLICTLCYRPNSYHASNRNLKRGSDLERRMRLLMCGHNEIMKLLSGLPSTQHDPHSFAVDLLLFTVSVSLPSTASNYFIFWWNYSPHAFLDLQPQLIQLCVCGVFRETRASSNTPMRAFSRSLIIVPQGQGFCIVNETITITNATSAQADVRLF